MTTKHRVKKPQDIGSLIVKQRRRLGIAQLELARALGSSQQTVSNWETGKQLPAGAKLLRLLEMLEIRMYCVPQKRPPRLNGGEADDGSVEKDTGEPLGDPV